MRKFYVGTHMPSWLSTSDVPLFVARQRIAERHKTKLPVAACDWALDSGGFTEITQYGGWRISGAEYAVQVRRYRDEIGRLDWAAPQDWMCEDVALQATGLTISEHQKRTVASFVELRTIASDLPFIPVLQGFAGDDYLRCMDMYEAAGVDLWKEKVVGLGSICRRQNTGPAVEICRALAMNGIELHGFGVKREGLPELEQYLFSADSLAWSDHARREGNARAKRGQRKALLDGCTHSGSCNNCCTFMRKYAAEIRDRHETPKACPECGGRDFDHFDATGSICVGCGFECGTNYATGVDAGPATAGFYRGAHV